MRRLELLVVVVMLGCGAAPGRTTAGVGVCDGAARDVGPPAIAHRVVKGRVIDASGSPLAHVAVGAAPGFVPAAPSPPVLTDARGRFAWTGRVDALVTNDDALVLAVRPPGGDAFRVKVEGVRAVGRYRYRYRHRRRRAARRRGGDDRGDRRRRGPRGPPW
ncbi:MAG: hypothetical protein KIT31_31770 [Deltaproteobacteria bacterium]|nr:hypothetical protein [Deltaproteobacteria bacterium]